MRKPEPTKRQIERFVTVSQLKLRFEFVLEFDRPVSVAKARETARHLLDALDATSHCEVPEEFAQATLKCADLKRLVRIEVN